MVNWYTYKSAAEIAYESGRITASWLHLLHGELQRDEQTKRWENRRPSTPRQQEVQKLWQQRGMLERTLANLRSVREITPFGYDKINTITAAMNTVSWLIDANKIAIKTTKSRIPNG